jgi:hypothetical protein
MEDRAMAQFDYNAEAELFPTRRRVPGGESFKYKRFAHAAQAIRFAIEDLPPQCLVGAFLEVDEQRFGSDEIRRLYESAEYPLSRRGVPLWSARPSIRTGIAGMSTWYFDSSKSEDEMAKGQQRSNREKKKPKADKNKKKQAPAASPFAAVPMTGKGAPGRKSS